MSKDNKPVRELIKEYVTNTPFLQFINMKKHDISSDMTFTLSKSIKGPTPRFFDIYFFVAGSSVKVRRNVAIATINASITVLKLNNNAILSVN